MSSRLSSPPPNERFLEPSGVLTRVWWDWVSRGTAILAGRQPTQLAEYTVAGLPDAASWKGCTVAVTDEAGGYCSAVSDGSIWRRSYDNAEVTV